MKAFAGTLYIQKLFTIVPSQLADQLPIQSGLLRFSWDHYNIHITRDISHPLHVHFAKLIICGTLVRPHMTHC